MAQSASRLNKAKPLASLEKKIKENLEAAAAESAALKIPENRVFLYFRVVAEETKSLARSDFDRAMTLAGRFGQTELRVYAELHAIQGVSSEQ